MIIGWAFALIMVIAMALFTFQGEIDNMLGKAEAYAEELFGPVPEPETNADGTVNDSGRV